MTCTGSISELKQLQDNWDGFGAASISTETISTVEQFAINHQGQAWWFAPMSNGNVMACRGDEEIEIGVVK